MIPNNNLSVLPLYGSIGQQNAKKWWTYGRVYPLFAYAGNIPPFQLVLEHVASPSAAFAVLYDANTGESVSGFSITSLRNGGLTFKQFATIGYDVLVYPATSPALQSLSNGRYYMLLQVNNHEYFSEVFTVVNDIQPYLKLEWWDETDLIMDAGAIVYTSPAFKNVLYLPSDIAKPEYQFEEEGEERDGYFFPVKQISYKQYRFGFLAPEYLLDVLRLVRMADHIRITKNGQQYSLDTFLITPEWESEGDVANVVVEFRTATVAKRIGVGYARAGRGDFNDDFNNDFNNQQ